MSVSLGGRFLPTKLELIRIKRSLNTAKNLRRILEDKRDVLLSRLNRLIEEAEKLREELLKPLGEAYGSLFKAYMEMGVGALDTVASTIPESMKAEISLRSIIGVRVPSISVERGVQGLFYGFSGTSALLDVASQRFGELVESICKAAEVENSIFRLAEEMRRTQRLLNALDYIVIPRYQKAIKFIEMVLEEREREEFVKLKHVKAMLERREEAERAELKV